MAAEVRRVERANTIEGMKISGRPSGRTPCRMARTHSASFFGPTPPLPVVRLLAASAPNGAHVHYLPAEILAMALGALGDGGSEVVPAFDGDRILRDLQFLGRNGLTLPQLPFRRAEHAYHQQDHEPEDDRYPESDPPSPSTSHVSSTVDVMPAPVHIRL